MRYKVLIALVVSCLVVSRQVAAAPDNTARFLMADPVSAMDWGLYRLETRLDSSAREWSVAKDLAIVLNAYPMVSVTYDWDENKVGILWLYTIKNVGESRIREACAQLVKHTRTTLLVDTDTGKPLGGAHTGIAHLFEHRGYTPSKKPKSLERDIDRMIYIKVTLMLSPRKDSKAAQIECQGPLLSREVMFVDK